MFAFPFNFSVAESNQSLNYLFNIQSDELLIIPLKSVNLPGKCKKQEIYFQNCFSIENFQNRIMPKYGDVISKYIK